MFIDGAYSLSDEAIYTLVQEIKNCQEDTVVVFAGYPKPMEELLSRNASLRFNIPFHISFNDYSAEEMAQIAVLIAQQRGFSIHPQALEKLTVICENEIMNSESGNGYFCRNLVENAILLYAERVYGGNNELSENNYVLGADDFSFCI